MIDLEQFVEGFVDGLKDSGQWLEMTKAQKLEAGKEAIQSGGEFAAAFRMISMVERQTTEIVKGVGFQSLQDLIIAAHDGKDLQRG
jgi:hypothetical protein